MSDDNDPDDVRPDDASVDIDEDRSQADRLLPGTSVGFAAPRLARSASVIVMALAVSVDDDGCYQFTRSHLSASSVIPTWPPGATPAKVTTPPCRRRRRPAGAVVIFQS